MARTGAMEVPAPSTPTAAGEPIAIFRRAQPQDGLEIAKATFLNGDRVDMGTLAAQLATSRSTLYRWFGSREQLLEEVLVVLAQDFSAAARAEAAGEGDARVLDFARRVMNATAQFQPLRSFVENEPQLALRLLIGERGAVHSRLVQALFEVVSEAHSVEEATALDTHLDVVVQVAATQLW